MANELVSLEQVQAQAITLDTQRQVAMDNVTLFVSKIEENIREAEAELNELIPTIQKAVNELAKKSASAMDDDSKAAAKLISKKYEDLVETLKKRGFRRLEVHVHATSSDDKNHQFHVALQQSMEKHSYRTDEIWYGTVEEKTVVAHPISKSVIAAQEAHREMLSKLTDAQKKLLELKIQAQDISRHEREGKALVIKAERKRTAEGKAMVDMVETAAAEKCGGISKYIAELSKSMKMLPGKK
jgi:hypothetical protein